VALDNVLGGIWVYYGTSGNTLSENEISGSAWEGIRTYSSGGTTISGNVIMNNKRGILIWGNPSGNGNTAMGNTLESNTFGLTLSFGTDSNSVYHNNFVNNNIQAIDNGVGNQWDHGARGNYWSDYVGEDLDGDGIGDTPYTGIFGVAGSVDNYPLMEPY
jgi:parallel beta-helix repeat protein